MRTTCPRWTARGDAPDVDRPPPGRSAREVYGIGVDVSVCGAVDPLGGGRAAADDAAPGHPPVVEADAASLDAVFLDLPMPPLSPLTLSSLYRCGPAVAVNFHRPLPAALLALLFACLPLRDVTAAPAATHLHSTHGGLVRELFFAHSTGAGADDRVEAPTGLHADCLAPALYPAASPCPSAPLFPLSPSAAPRHGAPANLLSV